MMQMLNTMEEKAPDLIYLLPEKFVEVPFEIFRTFKRGQYSLYDTEAE
jgi:hypothetical protein